MVSISGNELLTCDLTDVTLVAENGVLTGGKTVVSYKWSNGETTASKQVSAPGNNSVVLTYSNGCTASATIETKQDITEPMVNPITGTLLLCEGEETILSNLDAGGVWSIESMTPGTVASIDASGKLTTEQGGSVVVGYPRSCTGRRWVSL